MVKKNSIKLFGEEKVRAVWDEKKEKWFFSVVDIVAILTESPNIIRKTKCSRSAKRNDIFAKRNVYVFSSL